jgi:hypothetical protein
MAFYRSPSLEQISEPVVPAIQSFAVQSVRRPKMKKGANHSPEPTALRPWLILNVRRKSLR